MVQSFQESHKEKGSRIIAIKKKKHKKLKNSIEYQDLYLVRYGDMYVPYYLYDTYWLYNKQVEYDFQYAKDVLYRLLEDDNLNEKESKSIINTIRVLMNKIAEDKSIDVDSLNNMKLLNDEYKERLER